MRRSAQEGTRVELSYLGETIAHNQCDKMENNFAYGGANCPVRQVLDRIGDKWSSLIILQLGEYGMMRFNGISQAIGDISQKMLTVTLRHLEADGLVSRKAFAEIPPRVEYTLTPLGESLVPLLKQLVVWADANMGAIKLSRVQYVRA